MNNRFFNRLLAFWMLSMAFTFSSCDDEDPLSVGADTFTTSIDENPESGDVIGSVTGFTNRGTISFELTNQSPSGALAIDETTGELTVADASLFDFETNETITATATATVDGVSGSADITINLNDVDVVRDQLSDSKNAYDDATDGDWVEITSTEYANLASNLTSISKSGITDEQYNADSPSIRSGSTAWTLATVTTTEVIPESSYFFAFKYRLQSVSSTTGKVSGFKVKKSTISNYEGYGDVGNALPDHTGDIEDKFFLLKGFEGSMTTSEGHIAVYKPTGSRIGYRRANNTKYYFTSGELVENFASTQQHTAEFMYQGLSTTDVQW